VRLFGRRKPLHEQLAAAGELSFGSARAAPAGLSTEPPGWDGEQRGEPGIHGVPRPRRWDAVATAAAPGLRGESVHFVALADGTLVVEEDEPDDALAPLADAIEASLSAPYRAEAVRREPDTWAVAASRITVVPAPGLGGDHAELVVTRDGRTLTVDGRTRLGHAPALEEIGRLEGTEYVVRAERLDEDLWQVEASPL